jgi:hypothetical protein
MDDFDDVIVYKIIYKIFIISKNVAFIIDDVFFISLNNYHHYVSVSSSPGDLLLFWLKGQCEAQFKSNWPSSFREDD